MRNKRFINGLKNGGIAIAIIYFLLNTSIDFIGYILSGENIVKSIMSGTNESIPLNSFNGASGRLIVYIVFGIALSFIYTAGLYGSSNDLIEGKSVNSTTFMKNGRKYFFSTLGYTLLYCLVFGFITMFPRMIYTLAVKKVLYPNIPKANTELS
jgi:hypothetical protein